MTPKAMKLIAEKAKESTPEARLWMKTKGTEDFNGAILGIDYDAEVLWVADGSGEGTQFVAFDAIEAIRMT